MRITYKWTKAFLGVLALLMTTTLSSAQPPLAVELVCGNGFLLATGNQGNVYVITPHPSVLDFFVGDRINETPEPVGWTGVAVNNWGDLFVTSRHRNELSPPDACFGFYGPGGCSHLYHLDIATGAKVKEIGSTGVAFLSDMDISTYGTAIVNYYRDDLEFGDGGTGDMDLLTGTVTPTGPFTDPSGEIENGAITFYPHSEEILVAEVGFAISRIFRVDPVTRFAIRPFVTLALDGIPLPSGFDAMEITDSGHVIGLRGGSGALPILYQIDPVADPLTGFAEVEVRGEVILPGPDKLNGLEWVFSNLKAHNPTDTILHWNGVPRADSYDAIRGNVSDVVISEQFVDLGEVQCVENDSLDTTTGEGTELANPDSEIPLEGEAFFYVFRAFGGVTNTGYGFADGCAIERIVDFGDCPE